MIRLAQQTDLPAINAIYNQAIEQRFCTAHLNPVDMEYTTLWFSSHGADRYPVHVFVEGERITGWVSLGPYRTDRQALAHVSEVSYYVDRESRGRGIGSQLLHHAINVAPDYGLSILVAILLSKNPASIALLLKSGFSEWGCMPGIASIGEGSADHLYYGRKL